jgi:hypothetical protein
MTNSKMSDADLLRLKAGAAFNEVQAAKMPDPYGDATLGAFLRAFHQAAAERGRTIIREEVAKTRAG